MDVQFRQAAAAGNTVLMQQLLDKVDPFAAGAGSKKTAAHRAAENGHASALRLLFNAGDTFLQKDSEGKTPAQLAKKPDCVEVFKLAQIARETIRVTDRVLPKRFDVRNPITPDFQAYRIGVQMYADSKAQKEINELLSFVKEESAAAPLHLRERVLAAWQDQCESLAQYFIPYTNLLALKDEENRTGACGEVNGIAYAYLNYVKKGGYIIEWVHVPYHENNNHGFLIINGKQNQAALAVDAFFRKAYFMEHRAVVEIPYKLDSVAVNSTSLTSLPEAPWPQTKSIAKCQEIYAALEKNCLILLKPHFDFLFRQAASEGDIPFMKSLRGCADLLGAGPDSKKTAAHRAAEKGHASVLRLLYNWGDTFEKKDRRDKTPEQLTRNAECKTIFDLAKLAKQTVATMDKIFPQKFDVDAEADRLFALNRRAIGGATEKMALDCAKELLAIVDEEAAAAPLEQKKQIFEQWKQSQCLTLARLYEPISTLMSWEQEKTRAGACGENSSVALAYLVHIVKTRYLAELVVSEKGKRNHCFVFMNRKPDPDINEGWEGALLVDAFYRKSFFLEHVAAAEAPFRLESLELLRSSSRTPPPEAPWPQPRSLAKLEEIYLVIEGMFQKNFSNFIS